MPLASGISPTLGVDGQASGLDPFDDIFLAGVGNLGARADESRRDVFDEVTGNEEGRVVLGVGSKARLIGMPKCDLGHFTNWIIFEACS